MPCLDLSPSILRGLDLGPSPLCALIGPEFLVPGGWTWVCPLFGAISELCSLHLGGFVLSWIVSFTLPIMSEATRSPVIAFPVSEACGVLEPLPGVPP